MKPSPLSLCALWFLMATPMTISASAQGVHYVNPDVAERPPGRLMGTFYPEATVNIMGGNFVRGGYSPLGMFGPNNAALVGPLSVYRVKSAPVVTYSRGFDGIVRASEGVSFSYPNYPIASPVIYPTRVNTIVGAPSGVPPWWRRASDWIDQN